LVGNYEFAVCISRFVQRLIIDKLVIDPRAILVLAAIARVQMPSRITEIENVLLHFVANPTLSDPLLVFLFNLEDQLICARLIRAMASLPFRSPSFADQFSQIAEKVNIKESKLSVKFSDASDFLAQMRDCDYASGEFLKAAAQFLAKNSHLFRDPDVFLPFVKLCQDNLLIAELRARRAPAAGEFGQAVMSIKVGDGTCSVRKVSFPVTSHFLSLEHWFNCNVKDIDSDAIHIAYSEDTTLAKIVPNSECSSSSPAKQALLFRAYNIANYERYRFHIGEHVFSAADSPFEAASVANSQRSPFGTPFVSLSPGDANRCDFFVPVIEAQETKNLLDVLEVVHQMFPALDMENDKLAKRISAKSCPVGESIGRSSPHWSIVFHYPFLFPLNTRLLFVQLSTFDVAVALSIYHKHFEEHGRKIECTKLNLMVDRATLFDDGITIFQRLGATPMPFEIRFRAEPAVGVGPTHEFFTLFAESLCCSSLHLWRNDSSEEFVFNANGLFPRPDACPGHLRVVGTLCAKAFAMGTVVPFDFNPAFFKLARGETVEIGEVDPALAWALNCRAGLVDLPFTYPGIPTISVGPYPDVTPANVDEYVESVREFTVGGHMACLVSAFEQGFSSVVAWKAMVIFSDEELCQIIRGTLREFTRQEMKDNVIAAHGYQNDSPQIEMLFDVLLEFDDRDRSLFVRFATRSLPLGQLGSLDPKLTVALRVPQNEASPDASLPSVMTCANYLKLPEYSTKEILRERLRYAISEGQRRFDMT
jgi:hypothetical protein